MSGDQRRFDKPRETDAARMRRNNAGRTPQDERSRREREEELDMMRGQMPNRGQQLRPQQQRSPARQPASGTQPQKPAAKPGRKASPGSSPRGRQQQPRPQRKK